MLWPNHPVSHVLIPDDHSGFHYGAFLPSNQLPVAVISVFKEPFPVDLPDNNLRAGARFRKFACDPLFQGRGIGTKLLEHVFKVARSELDCDYVWCDARLSSAGWYQRRGMAVVGDIFFKENIEYVRMQRTIRHLETSASLVG